MLQMKAGRCHLYLELTKESTFGGSCFYCKTRDLKLVWRIQTYQNRIRTIQTRHQVYFLWCYIKSITLNMCNGMFVLFFSWTCFMVWAGFIAFQRSDKYDFCSCDVDSQTRFDSSVWRQFSDLWGHQRRSFHGLKKKSKADITMTKL